MKLRDYQVQCLQAIKDRYLAGTRRQLICLPTGTGKTVIFAQFPSFSQSAYFETHPLSPTVAGSLL